ncbi:MAG TPA: nucleotidyltransferase [Actinomycetota bacterium]|nr:nucleotidyltransferase [Actinomycetota bacterium]
MTHEIRHPDPPTMSRTFAAVTQVLDDFAVPYLVIGSIAADVCGSEGPWPREGSDIDLFLTESDARRAHAILGENGFHIEDTDEDWLLKAYREGVLIDLIFRAASTITLDEEMLERARTKTVEGRRVRIIAPEDYIVIQSRTFSRETPSHWFSACAVLEKSSIDWDYLLRRAEDRRDRAMALLMFARSNGITVPGNVLDRLYEPALARH